MEVHSTMESQAVERWEEGGGPLATDLTVSAERQYLQHQYHTNNTFTRKRQRHRTKTAYVPYNRHSHASAHDNDDDDDDDDDDDNDADDCSIVIENERRSLNPRGQVAQDDVTADMAGALLERREERHLYGSHHCPQSSPAGDAVVRTWSARATSLSCEGRVRGHGATDDTRPSDVLDSSTKDVQRIRCVVERVNGTAELVSVDGCDVTEVVKEEYVILASDILMREAVQLVMCRLGYSMDTAVRAKGAVQLKNWKSLPIHAITDNPTATIDDVLGHVKDFTLRLRLPGKEELGFQEEWRDSSVRCAVVALLRHFNQTTLAKLSPLSQSTISSIASGRYSNRLSRRKCRQFGTWYSSFLKNIANDFGAPTSARPLPSTRRTTFDPQHELPLLRNWYVTFPAPSDSKFNMFARILNSGHVRQHKPKVSPQKIKMWWRNERQKEKHLKQTAVTSVKKTTKSVPPATAPSLLLQPAVCRTEESRLRGKSTRGLMRVSSTCSDTTRLVSYRRDTSTKEWRDTTVQRTTESLRGHGDTGDSEVPNQFCISLSTDRQMPDLVPVISSPEAEALPQNLCSSPSPPLRLTPPPQSVGFSKPLHEQQEKIKDALFPSQCQGHAVLPRQPASTWSSSTSGLTSWSGHGRNTQDVAAAMSTQPPFFLPAWPQNYLPFLASSGDRSRSVTEQKSHFF